MRRRARRGSAPRRRPGPGTARPMPSRGTRDMAGTDGHAVAGSRPPLPPKQERRGECLAGAHRSELLSHPLEELAVVAAVAIGLVQPRHVPVMGAFDGGWREVSVQDQLGLVDRHEPPDAGAVVEEGEQIREAGVYVCDECGEALHGAGHALRPEEDGEERRAVVVNNAKALHGVSTDVKSQLSRHDGLVHAIGFMPADGLGGNFLNTPRESVATDFQTSAYSLKALAVGLLEPMKAAGAASVVSLDFDGRFAWPIYDWMGVAKAGLEAVTRYLAPDLGPYAIRVNTVSAGPIRTMAGKSIPGFDQIADRWLDRAPP